MKSEVSMEKSHKYFLFRPYGRFTCSIDKHDNTSLKKIFFVDVHLLQLEQKVYTVSEASLNQFQWSENKRPSDMWSSRAPGRFPGLPPWWSRRRGRLLCCPRTCSPMWSTLLYKWSVHCTVFLLLCSSLRIIQLEATSTVHCEFCIDTWTTCALFTSQYLLNRLCYFKMALELIQNSIMGGNNLPIFSFLYGSYSGGLFQRFWRRVNVELLRK